MGKKDFVIVGLGNPGEQYILTRHNAGFLIIDELAKRWNTSILLEKWKALYVSLQVKGAKVHLVKPLTFMNRSGNAVANFIRFYKVSPDQLLVVHDDLDMAPGRVKLVQGGGAGGHNGIKSLVESLGTNNFFRLKIGIGRPGQGGVHQDFPVDKYVLSHFEKDDFDLFQSRYDSFEQGILFFLQGHPAKAMNLLNSIK